MPQDMLREIWLGLKRFWGLRWPMKAVILASMGLTILAAVQVIAGFRSGPPGPTEADRRNEELMASFPVYGGATLVEKFAFDDFRQIRGLIGHLAISVRSLTYVYATPADPGVGEQMLTFYRQWFEDEGWETAGCEECLGYRPDTFFDDDAWAYVTSVSPGKEGVYGEIFPISEAFPNLAAFDVEVTPVAPPLSGATTFFAVTIEREVD